MEDYAADSCDFTRIRCIQQGPQASQIQFRRFDDLVRPYAGRRNGKRSPRRLFSLSPDPVAIRQYWRTGPTSTLWSRCPKVGETVFSWDCRRFRRLVAASRLVRTDCKHFRIRGNPEVVSASVGLVPTNALVFTNSIPLGRIVAKPDMRFWSNSTSPISAFIRT